ncbi:MAG: hypothetical protein K6G12_11140 [Lachnospiraceae bacterium]|nr:hypothetical protein [Lachnospiraceae bacterium]
MIGNISDSWGTNNDLTKAYPGPICFEAGASGHNRVAYSIRKVFERIRNESLMEDIDRIDFHIKGNISDEEAGLIEDCINRLLGWNYGSHGIQYMYEYTIDEAMSETCETCAYIHFKKLGNPVLPEKNTEENGEFARPEDMKSDALWDIYSMFHNMRRPYIWVGSGNNFRYSLYLIKDAVFEGTLYIIRRRSNHGEQERWRDRGPCRIQRKDRVCRVGDFGNRKG